MNNDLEVDLTLENLPELVDLLTSIHGDFLQFCKAFNYDNYIHCSLETALKLVFMGEYLRWKFLTFDAIRLFLNQNSQHPNRLTMIQQKKLLECILSWRIFWMAMLNRHKKKLSPSVAFTKVELEILNKFFLDKNQSKKKKRLSDYLLKLAKLGGYLARSSDPPPGNMVMWRGLLRLTDIQIGFNIALEIVGN